MPLQTSDFAISRYESIITRIIIITRVSQIYTILFALKEHKIFTKKNLDIETLNRYSYYFFHFL